MLATVKLGVCPVQVPAGRGGSRCAGASETQARAIGLEAQLVVMGWGQRGADRLSKGQVFANLLTLWVYLARLEGSLQWQWSWRC